MVHSDLMHAAKTMYTCSMHDNRPSRVLCSGSLETMCISMCTFIPCVHLMWWDIYHISEQSMNHISLKIDRPRCCAKSPTVQ